MATRQTTRKSTTTKKTKPATGRTVTDEQMDKAAAAAEFIKANPNETGTLKITGAKAKWAGEGGEDIVYNVEYRLVGTRDQIRNVLKNSNLDEAEINRTMREDLITKQNFEGEKAEQYEELIEQTTRVREEKKLEAAEEGPEYSLEDLAMIVSQLGIKAGAVGVGKGVARPTKGKAAASPRARGPKRSLADRIKDLPQGYVLDVTGITPEGKGVKSKEAPKAGGKSKRVGVPGLPIISSNYADYATAIGLLGKGYEQYAEQYAKTYGTGAEAVIPQGTTISPRKSAARTGTRAATTAKTTTARPVARAATTTKPTAKPVTRATTAATTAATEPPKTTTTTAPTARRIIGARTGTTTATTETEPKPRLGLRTLTSARSPTKRP